MTESEKTAAIKKEAAKIIKKWRSEGLTITESEVEEFEKDMRTELDKLLEQEKTSPEA